MNRGRVAGVPGVGIVLLCTGACTATPSLSEIESHGRAIEVLDAGLDALGGLGAILSVGSLTVTLLTRVSHVDPRDDPSPALSSRSGRSERLALDVSTVVTAHTEPGTIGELESAIATARARAAQRRR